MAETETRCPQFPLQMDFPSYGIVRQKGSLARLMWQLNDTVARGFKTPAVVWTFDWERRRLSYGQNYLSVTARPHKVNHGIDYKSCNEAQAWATYELIHRELKNGATFILALTLSNVNRSWKCLYCRKGNGISKNFHHTSTPLLHCLAKLESRLTCLKITM